MAARAVSRPSNGCLCFLRSSARPSLSTQPGRNPRLPHSSTSSEPAYEPRPHAEPGERVLRWAQTPPQYKAPYRSKPEVRDNDFTVNNDPERLDEVYNRLLGGSGHNLLGEETKWLAVTHKSFDHGKRGYNERLAVLGTYGVVNQKYGGIRRRGG